MIKDIKISTVPTSKNTKSIKVSLITDKGTYSASIPSGTSKGGHEAVELPFKNVVSALDKIKPKIIGLEENWKKIDKIILNNDKTEDLSEVGGNLALGISISVARAVTKGELWKLGRHAEFPIQISNIIGGGKHGGKTDWQEFLLFPKNTKTPKDAANSIYRVYNEIETEIRKKKTFCGKNREGAIMANLNNIQTLDMLSDFADKWNMNIGIDCAATSLWDGRHYNYKKMRLLADQQFNLIVDTVKAYKIRYIEDPFHDEDFDNFSKLTKKVGKECLIVGDDLFCTNPDRLKLGTKSANGIIIKPNQIGTLSKTLETVFLAKKAKLKTIASHRSGETMDDWLADLSVAFNAELIKISFDGFEWPKINRLVKLWDIVPGAKMSRFC